MNKLLHFRPFSTLITAPMFYVNGAPHVGHAYSVVLADAHCRFQRLRRGERTDREGSVRLVTGTDEHGPKVAEAARLQNVQPQTLADTVSDQFRSAFEKQLGIENLHFVRTSSETHRTVVSALWNRLIERDYIYKGHYEGWYCRADEAFLSEKDVTVLDDGQRVSLESNSAVERVSEASYMFRLSHFKEPLRDWLQSHPCPVLPETRANQAIAMLHDLQDLSISRPRSRVQWGIEVPGDADQTIYVWLDALSSYLTGADVIDEQRCNFEQSQWWPAYLQVIGKDILRFHAIYWPAFLMAADLPLPKRVLVHSHLLVRGSKMSKRAGNAPASLKKLSALAGAEALNFWLLRRGKLNNDAEFSEQSVVDVYKSDLCSVLGNLAARCSSKILVPQRQWGSPLCYSPCTDAMELIAKVNNLYNDVLYCYEHELNISNALEHIFVVLRATNAFISALEPWKLARNREQRARLQEVMFVSLESLRVCSLLLQPVLPQAMHTLLDFLDVEQRSIDPENCSFHIAAAQRTLQSDNSIILFNPMPA